MVPQFEWCPARKQPFNLCRFLIFPIMLPISLVLFVLGLLYLPFYTASVYGTPRAFLTEVNRNAASNCHCFSFLFLCLFAGWLTPTLLCSPLYWTYYCFSMDEAANNVVIHSYYWIWDLTQCCCSCEFTDCPCCPVTDGPIVQRRLEAQRQQQQQQPGFVGGMGAVFVPSPAQPQMVVRLENVRCQASFLQDVM